MKLPGFLGGNDVQRSLNLADNRCVNLYQTMSDDGSVGALVSTPGLTLQVTNPASAISTGTYTASNGRVFEVAGTTLYELTSAGGVISTTSRGTVTAGITKFSDNGTDMILVNGTDGWLFRFATNALKKITVKQADFTVTATGGSLTSVGTVSLNTRKVRISADGLHAYATGGGALVAQYSVNQTTGALTPLTPATVATGGSQAYDVVISPDDLSVYVIDYVSNIVSQFSRNVSTGLLTALGTPTIACGTGPYSARFSPDGLSLYVLSAGNIALLPRNSSTFQLSAATNYANAALSASIIEFAISNDGLSLYVGSFGSSIYQYARNAVDGTLTAMSPASVVGIPYPITVAISPDDRYVYAVCAASKSIIKYSRSPTSFQLTLESDIVTSTVQPTNICISDDGLYAYLVSYADYKVLQYRISSVDGSLAGIGSIISSTGAQPVGIAITDGNVYIARVSGGVGDIEQFSRDTGAAVFSSTGHGLVADDIIQLSSTGTLPNGLETLTDYYVLSSGLAADTFKAALTSGGAAATSSGTQSGTHTYTSIGYGFPEGCKTISYCNGRFIACEPGTQNFYCSDVLDAPRWDALNVQTADAFPDPVTCEVVSHNEIIVFSKNSGEVFYDSGTYPSPFVRNSSGIFTVGCDAPYSIAEIDNSIFWLGQGKAGSGIIYRMIGYTPQRISTGSIEYAIQGMSDITDATGFAYQMDGHHFYCITFPTGDKSYSYDLNTGLWHERASFANGSFSRWEAMYYCYAFGKHLVTDRAEGHIYSMDLAVYADGSAVHKWLRSWRCPDTGMQRQRHSKLEIHLEKGVGILAGDEPTIMLKWSDDGGHTWSSEVWRDLGIGSLGEYAKRVVFYRLGMTKGQPRIYELSGTAAVKTVLLEAHLD